MIATETGCNLLVFTIPFKSESWQYNKVGRQDFQVSLYLTSTLYSLKKISGIAPEYPVLQEKYSQSNFGYISLVGHRSALLHSWYPFSAD